MEPNIGAPHHRKICRPLDDAWGEGHRGSVSALFSRAPIGIVPNISTKRTWSSKECAFGFCNSRTMSLPDAPKYRQPVPFRVPAYQVDRAVLDEEVLRRAEALGAEVWRTATVSKVQLSPGGQQRLEVRRDGQTTQVSARWLVDASGVAAVLARQEGWWRPNKAHPTTGGLVTLDRGQRLGRLELAEHTRNGRWHATVSAPRRRTIFW
jgi:hypothetical protein